MISLRELVEQGRISKEDGTRLPDYDKTWISAHGSQYLVSPMSVSFILRGEYDLFPSEPLEQVVLCGFYTVTRDSLIVNIGRKGYELHPEPLKGEYPLRTKRTIVEFKKR